MILRVTITKRGDRDYIQILGDGVSVVLVADRIEVQDARVDPLRQARNRRCAEELSARLRRPGPTKKRAR